MYVQIHGQQYAVRSELDPQYVAEIAAYLDEKMRLAAREIASADVVRIAVIAALNLTDELFRARAQEPDGRERSLVARAEEIERIVDALLGEPEPNAAAG